MPKKILEPQTILFPLPAVMVSCQKGDEKPNIITLGWVGVVCSEPPMVGISIRKSRFSHGIVKESKEFVINVPMRKILKETDFCGTKSGRNVDKFAETKLTPIKSSKVNAPLIKECPVNLECVVKQILELGTHDLFIGEIVETHIDSEYLDKSGNPDVGKMGLFCYCPKAQQYRAVSEVLGKYGSI
jgi:flavin reductase (DIM6/NTAB) family NADH-FMN oxidoreductase RutF